MSEFTTFEFQIDVLAFILSKPNFYSQKKGHLKDLKFDSKKVQWVYDQLKESFGTYSAFPTKSELLERTKKYLHERSEYIDIDWLEYEHIINEAYSRPVTSVTGEELNYYIQLQHRDRMVEKLANAPREKLASTVKELEADFRLFRRANYQDLDFGLDYFSHIDTVVSLIDDYNQGICIPCGFEQLDKALKGGTRKGEVNCFVGTLNMGKTTILLNMSKGFVQNGARVVHIYLDSMEEETALRMASCWLGESIDADTDLNMIREKLEGYKDSLKSQLFMKQFPAKTISAADIDEYLTNLRVFLYTQDIENGVPEEYAGNIDILIVDYFDLLLYDGKEEGFMVDEAKAQEFNALAIKHKVGVWTASQGGTEAMKSEHPKLYQAHGYKSRFHPLANILMLCCPEDERQLLRRHFTLEFAKARRPVPFPSIAFIMDVVTQRIFEDPDRLPMIQSPSGKEAPSQTAYEANGEAVAKKREELNAIQ